MHIKEEVKKMGIFTRKNNEIDEMEMFFERETKSIEH